MNKKIFLLILIACILFQISCATTKKVSNEKTDYNTFEKEERIFVKMKDNKKYEIINFTITDSTIIGTWTTDNIFPTTWKEIVTGRREKKIEINLEDVERISVEEEFSLIGAMYLIAVALAITWPIFLILE